MKAAGDVGAMAVKWVLSLTIMGNSHSVLGVSRVSYDVTCRSGTVDADEDGRSSGKSTAAGVIGVTGLARVWPSVTVIDEPRPALLEFVKSSVSKVDTEWENLWVKAPAVVIFDEVSFDTDVTAIVILGVGKWASDTT